MVTIGVDPHKPTHTAAAVDQLGVEVEHRTALARPVGNGQLLEWARALDVERVWAVEDVRNVSGSFIVESDGSGGLYATDVRGSVIVENDGSGSIDVNKVGKDFKVDSKGSGSIDYTEVTGSVDIPERHRDRRYRRGEDR
jgi:hypothetical protein